MKIETRRVLAGVLLASAALAAPGAASDAEGGDTPPGSLRFEGRNLLTTAHGTFQDWRFRRVEIDREHPERSVVEVEVDVGSLDTGIGRRDDHLRSEDFFDVARFPKALVRIHDASADGESEAGNPRYRAKFDVRIRDVERTLEGGFDLVSTSPPKVEGEILLNRVDFGVGGPHSRWNPVSPRDEIPVRFSTVIPTD